MDGSAVVASAREYASGVEVGFVDTDGVERSGPLACWWAEPFELALPVRPFASFKGQKNFTGEYWAATSRTHVGYESWVERDAAMALDFDPAVVALASQPFRLAWTDGERERRHTPDYFARLLDGTGVVVDVRPENLVDEAALDAILDGTEKITRASLEAVDLDESAEQQNLPRARQRRAREARRTA
ncbi:TnsA-like heteromeric transposase endonuclease subunit [Streptomyces sp. NRRL S-495]|uniref:TnsA-like heteromeric transposase endonuclease subunit n=1 Tax=Streptomyces sp. NRRL S-495 TaxID=1609133 RepID=UPI000A8C9229|nr:TnsA-like heteromeric transposase endonuclease subunit [Streptomyces sp. NRRL S-495]